MTSLGLGRRRAGQLAMVPWASQFGLGPLGQETGKTLANELYHGGFPPPVVEVPISWIRPGIQFKHDPPIGIAEVARTGGQTARAVNEATIAASHGRAWKFTTTVDSVAAVDAPNLAQHAVDFGTTPRPRSAVITLVLNSRTDTEIWRILGVKQGTHIRLTGAPGEQTQLVANPWFETGVTGWTATGCVRSQSTAWSRSGSSSMLITPDGVSPNAFAEDDPREVFPLVDYVVDGWLFSPLGYSAVGISVNWYDVNNGYLSTGSSVSSIGAGFSSHRHHTFTSPAGAAYARVHPVAMGTPASSNTLHADEVTLTGPRPGRQWPAGALDHVVSGISHQFSADARLVMWTTSPIVGAALGEPGPWFYSEASLTTGTDTVPA